MQPHFVVVLLLSLLVLHGNCLPIVQTNHTLLPTDVSYGLSVTSSLALSPNEIIVGGYVLQQAFIDTLNVITNGSSDMFLASIDRSTSAYNWIKVIGGAGNDYLYSFAIDSNNEYIIGGNLQGTSDYGGGNTSANSSGIVLIKLSSDRSFIWSKVYGTSTVADSVSEIGVDSNNNIIVCGSHNGLSSWGGGNLTAYGMDDWGIAKYNTSGYHLWSLSFGTPNVDVAKGVAVLSNDYIVVVGYFTGNITVGNKLYTSQGLQDAMMVQLDPDGNFVWCEVIATSGKDIFNGIDIDSFNNIYITGTSYVDAKAACVFKYQSNSLAFWKRCATLMMGSDVTSTSVSVGSDNSILMAGYFAGYIEIGDDLSIMASFLYPQLTVKSTFGINFNSSGAGQWTVNFADDVTSVIVSSFPGAIDHAIFASYTSYTQDLNGESCGDKVSNGSTTLLAFLEDLQPSPTPTPSASVSITPSISNIPIPKESSDGLPLNIALPVILVGGMVLLAGGLVGGFLLGRRHKTQAEVEMN